MNIKSFIAIAASLALCSSSFAQVKPTAAKPSDYEFKTVKEIPVTSMKNQYRSGTCWCFSALSFLESEVIKAKGIKDEAQYPDFSEMFISAMLIVTGRRST